MRPERCERAVLMTWASLLLTFSFLAARGKVGRWGKCSPWCVVLPRATVFISSPSPAPYCGTTRLQRSPGRASLGACWYMRNSTLQHNISARLQHSRPNHRDVCGISVNHPDTCMFSIYKAERAFGVTF